MSQVLEQTRNKFHIDRSLSLLVLLLMATSLLCIARIRSCPPSCREHTSG